MVDTKASDVPAPTAPAESRAPDTKKSDAVQARPPAKGSAAGARTNSAAAIDELLAKEALASMKRARSAAHTEIVRPKLRTPVPSTTIVVKPGPSQAWKAPFVTLAMLVCICTVVCAGALAYLLMRPAPVATTATAELRHLREAVAQLQRNVSTLSNDVAATGSVLDTINKTANDRYGRVAQNLERVERAQSVAATKIERMTAEKVQVAQASPAALTAPSSEITGSIKPQPQAVTTRRAVAIPGWSVRRAYEGVAILEGQPGVIEVVLGQDVPNVGRIEDIKYENGRWAVWTSKGVIRSR
ncbi:hypothetical protein MXD81_03165 [Microbacteriaceae bacterium K1510]|nr:hypothetical protein [Microbacteriaceae bacterium K1510]